MSDMTMSFKTVDGVDVEVKLSRVKSIVGDTLVFKRSKFRLGVATRIYIKIHPDDVVRATDTFNTYVSDVARAKANTTNETDTSLLN